MHTHERAITHAHAHTLHTRASGSIAACVHTLAKVRIQAGDFVVGEGLLRSCMAKLQVPKGACPNVWDMLLLQDATETYASLMDKLVFNTKSRKAEGDQARDKLVHLQEQFPVTSAGACASGLASQKRKHTHTHKYTLIHPSIQTCKYTHKNKHTPAHKNVYVKTFIHT